MSTNYIDQITDFSGTTHDIAESDSTRIFRATCSTAAGTAAKVATLNTSSNKNFNLAAGVRVAVTFTYGNSAATPTLQVNGDSTGTAKQIAFATASTTRATGNGSTYNTWGPYETIIFTYDGTYWIHSGSSLGIYNAYTLADSKSSFSGSYNDLSDKPSNNVTGSGTNGYLVKWNGTNTITDGPQLGSNQTTFLRNDGSWATPTGTTYSPGSGLSLSGTTFNHANSITAQNTQAVYPIKIDGQGHISAYGNAVTIPNEYSLPIAKFNTLGGVKPAYTTTGAASLTTSAASNTSTPSIQEKSSESNRYYAIEADKNGILFVNVPWTNVNSSYLTSSSSLDATKLTGQIPSGCYTDTNTKNTAGSTDTSSKIFLIGATSQAANPQTYSHDTAYVGTDGCLYSGGAKVLTAHQDISGKIDTAGTGLSKSGTTLNHSNSVTAQTTQAIYPIKIDAQGHISAYGSAVTPLTASSSLNAAKLTGTVPSGCYTNTNTFKSFYGTCSTAAATAAKDVTLSVTTGWQLVAGTVVGVKFTNTNTFSATADSHVTLNVNSTGAKNIYYANALPTGTNTTAFGRANYINYYMYDGSQWVWLSSSTDNNSTYYLQTYTTRQTNANVAWHSNTYIKYLLASSSMTTNKPTFTGDGVAKRTADGMILHLSWDNNEGWDTQIAIPNSGGMISTRGGSGLENDTQKWTDWVSYARADKAISDITRSGTTFTATRADGTTFTFTQQDNNTTYSASTGLSLSSNAFSLAKITKSNTTSTASPAHSGTFTAIDSVTYDDYGRVTGVNTKTVTLPASGNTDTKVKITAVTPSSETTNYPLTYTATSGTVEVNAHTNNRYWIKQGTASVTGYVYHGLGNSTATGTANNSQGWVRVYGPNTGYGQITYANSTANTTHTLPATGGTVLNTGTTSYSPISSGTTDLGTLKINGTSYTLSYTNSTYSAGTGLSISSGTNTFNLAYSVGDVIITSTNTNPSAHYGGTWELIDKQFKSQDVTPTLTYNTTYTNSSNVTFVARATGHTVHIRARITLLANISGDIAPITWDVTKLGFANTNAVFVYYPNASYTIPFECCADRVRVYNANTRVYATYILTSKFDNMVDSYCDKFFWKRTA